MLPARLAQLHPANEGLFIGLRLSAAKQGLARAEAGANLAAPHPPAAQTTPHACSGLALSPRSRLLVSAVLNCRQQLKRARERDIVERVEGTVLACWAVTWQAWIKRFVFLLSNPGSVLVGFIKMDVVFLKCCWEVMVFWTVLRVSKTLYKMQMMRKESWWKMMTIWSINLTSVHVTVKSSRVLSPPPKPQLFFIAKGFLPAACAPLSLFTFPMNLWISYYCSWLLLSPLWLDPGKFNSGQLIELVVSEHVNAYEFFSFFSRLVFECVFAFSWVLLEMFDSIFMECCLLKSHSSRFSTYCQSFVICLSCK